MAQEAFADVRQVGPDTQVLAFDGVSGIGYSTVQPPATGWADRVIVQLDIRGLEGFAATNAQGKEWSHFIGHEEREKLVAGRPIEVELPKDLLQGGGCLKLHWVDFYRC
eukprot:TRINITY_DN8365_c0_g1_i1.p4 TRINITY_DN8365_c0_g1~~TRINITY_DN8365_c0_g1_i1.p4  ORF type:complete len:109 (+),score=26.92 TRINITY_DN8365_c0_g1_i1:94-420(+)